MLFIRECVEYFSYCTGTLPDERLCGEILLSITVLQ